MNSFYAIMMVLFIFISFNMKLNKKIIGWDTETTGLNFLTDRIIQIAMVVKKDEQIIDELNLFINPEIKVAQDAFEVHKISDAFLADKPKFHQVYQQVLDFLMKHNPDELTGYNADFDTTMLTMEFERLRKDYPELMSMHEYIADKYPDYIPYKERKYVFNHENQEYTYTGRTISELDKEIYSLIDMFPCTDLMPALIQGTLSLKNANSGRESLDVMAERLGVDLEERKAAHDALIDTRVALECYEKAVENNLIAGGSILVAELNFSGLNIPKYQPQLNIAPEIANQAVSFKDRQNFNHDLRLGNSSELDEKKPYVARPSLR